jgi:ABC-type transport system involved in cytochrome c biogenesis permease component
MKARHIVGHIFFALLTIFSLLIGLAGIEEFGSGWLWLGLFFSALLFLDFNQGSYTTRFLTF